MASAVPPEEIPTGHTSTDQWQSFEMRMRQRRIDRLVARADAALGAGSIEEGRAAIDELEQLSPQATELDRLRPQLAQALESRTSQQAAATMPPGPLSVEPLVQPAVELPPSPRTEAPVFKSPERPEPAIVAPALLKPPVVTPSPIQPAVPKPVIVKPQVVRPAVVKPAVVKPMVATPPVVGAQTSPVVAPRPSRKVEPPTAPLVTTPVIVPPVRARRPAPPQLADLEMADAPAASAPLHVDVARSEDSRAAATESVRRRGSRWAQMAAAILIGASVGWLAGTRAPWMARGAPASASAPAVPAPAPPVAVHPSEAVPASPPPPPAGRV